MFSYLYIIVAVVAFYIIFIKRSGRSHIPKLLKQSARYATAAQQDDSPIVATLHANYSVAYLNSLKDISTPKEIHNTTGVDLKKFEEHILNVQDMVTKKVLKKCPEFAGDIDFYLSAIGGQS